MADGVWLVTRQKDNARDAVREDHPVPQYRHVLKDQTLCLAGVGAAAKYPIPLRRIEVWNPEKPESWSS